MCFLHLFWISASGCVLLVDKYRKTADILFLIKSLISDLVEDSGLDKDQNNITWVSGAAIKNPRSETKSFYS